MCGIFGTIHFSVSDKASVLKSLAHRGPDEQNVLEVGPVTWYHARLAIQDLSPGGRQPMKWGEVYITFNGEIYNHQELREKHGLHHSSRSDTMTLLMLYEKMGMDMFGELDGMFALGIYDAGKGKVLLARDRAGKKPLYLWESGRQHVFSSELGALRNVLPLQIDESAIAAYLFMGYHVGSSTPYSDVKELAAGSYMEIDVETGASKTQRWYDISEAYLQRNRGSLNEALEDLDHRLHRAVSLRMDSSDLEVGCFLSGGIDSGLVTAIASGCTNTLRTFTVQMPGSYDESSLAAQVANQYGTRHTNISISFDHLRDDLPAMVSAYGEPFFDSSAIPSYYVSREAKRHITVVLNGDGADELFGGYRRYLPFRYYDFFAARPLGRRLAHGLASLLPPGHDKKSRYNYLYRLLKFAACGDLTDMYASATTDVLAGCEKEFLIRPNLVALGAELERIRALPLTPLSKMLMADFNILLPGDLLPKMDIATMAHGLEGRSPFLGKDLLEFAPGLPDDWKVKGNQTKFLLRKLAGKYLPPDLPHQPKRGFEIPLKDWMDGTLKELCLSYLLGSQGALYPRFISPAFVEDLIARKIAVSDEKRAKILYTLLCLEIWYRHVHRSGGS